MQKSYMRVKWEEKGLMSLVYVSPVVYVSQSSAVCFLKRGKAALFGLYVKLTVSVYHLRK